ncbi:hypothetical protein SASPL_117747 [Salvia splendens]|uniref:Uncharacterized protein n=1 Tax=Salvia splendens TaxID=180675 RepID=A0A8X8ZXV4_SALSN|nr:hypothetical protein SASPL_117747 [Salvia splendens]
MFISFYVFGKMEEEELYRYCKLHSAMWCVPNWSCGAEGGGRACPSDGTRQLPGIQMRPSFSRICCCNTLGKSLSNK